MDMKELLLRQKLVAAMKSGDLRKVEDAYMSILRDCVGIHEYDDIDTHEDEVIVSLN